MTLSRWDRLEVLLEQAGDVPAAQRAAFVERETGGDPALRAELSALLDASPGAAEYVSRLRRELRYSPARKSCSSSRTTSTGQGA